MGRRPPGPPAVWRGEQFTIDLASANPLLFLGGAPAALTASLKSALANLAFDGTASLGENPYVDGQVNFSAPSARKVLEWSQAGILHGSTLGAVAMKSRVMGDAARLRFEDAEITLDGKPAHGALDLMLTGKLPMMAGTLAFDTLDLRAFLSAFTPLEPSVGSGPGIIDADFAEPAQPRSAPVGGAGDRRRDRTRRCRSDGARRRRDGRLRHIRRRSIRRQHTGGPALRPQGRGERRSRCACSHRTSTAALSQRPPA